MYLFDTNIITNILKKNPSVTLIGKLKSLPVENQYISVLTIAEIIYGAYKTDNPEKHINNLKTILLPQVKVLPFDAKAAYLAGKMQADLEKMGCPLDFVDIQIAAIAVVNDKILITDNQKHFKRISILTTENWL